jgi:hypothetical protein
MQLLCLLYLGFWNPLENFLKNDYRPSMLSLMSSKSTLSLSSTYNQLTESERILYNLRHHVTQQQQQQDQKQYLTPDDRLPLIVGGSDGSGTRAVVNLLCRLGVPMMVDDVGTMDIHGKALFHGKGWPPLAKYALELMAPTYNSNFTSQRNPNKDTSTDKIVKLEALFNAPVSNQVQQELQKLKLHLDQRYDRWQQRPKNNSSFVRNINSTSFPLETNVSYGFKAPITLVLVPLFQRYLFPNGFRFLHVVRDGRDVALSNNQSPVTKFYNATYGDEKASQSIQNFLQKPDHLPALAMQLWNDWNINLWDYMTQQKTRQQQTSSPVEYFVVRMEDLLHPQTRLKLITQLATFVGSTKPPSTLCCLSQMSVVDMGQSNHLGKDMSRRDSFGHYLLEDYLIRKRQHYLASKSTNNIQSNNISQEATSKSSQNATSTTSVLWKPSPQIQQQHQSLIERPRYVEERIAQRRKYGLSSYNFPIDAKRERLHDSHHILRNSRRKRVDPSIADYIGRRRLSLSSDEQISMIHDNNMHSMRLDNTSSSSSFHKEKLRDRHSPRQPLSSNHLHLPHDVVSAAADAATAESHSPLIQLLMAQLDSLKISDSSSSVLRLRDDNLSNRYGKWYHILASNPDLNFTFHQEGAQALALFGYHPPRQSIESSLKDVSLPSCDVNVPTTSC